ncbi:MAG: cytochrome c [Proteobacteria bacterium]|nr:cytochrome c [Pseudomonadota bacterium]MBU4298332.1 cytochrome c [Pseudomonadota bacterium]MCG2749836.1 cytochrome c [Desulfobulbaceae bacterium]
MNILFDILLQKPLPDPWLQGLLFVAFTLHLLFVLFTLGTAMLAFSYMLRGHWGGSPRALRLAVRIAGSFMSHKSLAVVLGVAPLLLIQVTYTIPFFTGVTLFAPYWLAVIGLLIVAFLVFDLLAHRLEGSRFVALLMGIIGLVTLLIVPGIFVLILSVSEHPGNWLRIIDQGYRLQGPLLIHWLLRYLHVLGAALVFGAAFHYFFAAEGGEERRSLLRWLTAGTLLQVLLGIMLYGLLPIRPEMIANLCLFAGVAGCALFLWYLFTSSRGDDPLSLRTIVPMTLFILVAMLLTRQLIQNRAFLPVTAALEEKSRTHGQEIGAFARESLDRYQNKLAVVYDNGPTIYAQACAFCHGELADGAGPEAKNLAVPPENVAAVRTTAPYLHQILTQGVPGSAMPYFTFLDRNKLDSLTDYLNGRYQTIGKPGPLPADLTEATMGQAGQVYEQTCTPCHGQDGRGTEQSRGYRPPPPDLTAYSLTPQRTFQVISKGYPGTLMPGFAQLPEEMRWGLVQVVNGKRIP